ncbi:MAG: hypothetical protein CMJ18_21395 [Phycisphaeraceae bacterium]|nr:hypothetical protein [Phycisphaeraceae bacterium]
MSDNPKPFDWNDGRVLVVLAVITWLLALLFSNVAASPTSTVADDPGAVQTGVVVTTTLNHLCRIAAAVLFSIGIIRWAIRPHQQEMAERQQRLEHAVGVVAENLLISETAKRIAFRDLDRHVIQDEVRERIDAGDFDAASHMLEDAIKAFDSLEAERLRSEIERARDDRYQKSIGADLSALDALMEQHQWDRALAEAERIQREFADTPRVAGLVEKVHQARESYKLQLERQFLDAAQRDEVDHAMDLMKELDRYLTEEEAEPFREAARGVVTKKRENLAVQFKIAVHDKEWAMAVRIGEQIINEFANTKMAQEVRNSIDILRQRAEATV